VDAENTSATLDHQSQRTLTMALTQQQRTTVLQALERGASLRTAAREADIASESTIRDLVAADEDFAAQYTRARDQGLDALADECLQISDSATRETFQESRLRFDARRWYLSKLAPKRYGDRLELNAKVTTSAESLSTEELMQIAAGKTRGG
jgi:hypothetical protein